MANAKSLIAAGVLAVPCVDAFVAPSSSPTVSALRGSPAVSVQPESSFGAYSALAAASAGAAVLSFVGTKKPVARRNVVCNFSKESQIGAMEPLGFFDPLDFCKDEATFKDLRAKEIKHGRLATWLCLWIASFLFGLTKRPSLGYVTYVRTFQLF